VINLLTVYFFHNEWITQTPDYVREKYDRTFSCLPDRIKIVGDRIVYPKTISNDSIKGFYKNLMEYRKKWSFRKDELTKEDIILLFTVSYISNGYLNPFYLEKRYSDLFTSFDFINESSQIRGLHELIREAIRELEKEREKDFQPYKRVTKLLNIKKRIEEK
jgi:hypothetical protein